MSLEREDYFLQPKYPEWDEIKLGLDKGELREIIDCLIEEPRAFDGLKRWISDNYYPEDEL